MISVNNTTNTEFSYELIAKVKDRLFSVNIIDGVYKHEEMKGRKIQFYISNIFYFVPVPAN